jgi:hypothetical protein
MFSISSLNKVDDYVVTGMATIIACCPDSCRNSLVRLVILLSVVGEAFLIEQLSN